MSNLGTYVIDGEIGIITIDSPPVNALGVNVRRALEQGFKRFTDESDTKAIVLICGGRTFFAGADISEFGKAPEEPSLHKLFDIIEGSPKPVVAAIHGTALGGGYELALVCSHRVAAPSAKVGLPEVSLGLLPGAGGTQRLPRIVGAAAALDIILSGAPVNAIKALELGMIDSLVTEGKLLEDAVAFARKITSTPQPSVRVRDRVEKITADKGNTALFDDARKKWARAARGFKAPANIISAIQAAVELPFDQGMARERELFHELHDSTESAAQRYCFFAERETSKIPDLPTTTKTLAINSAGVIGAGTMGGGIAMNFLNAGIPVTIIETNEEALSRGVGIIRKNYESSVKKGRLTQEQVENRMSLLEPALSIDALCDADLTIEAVFEQMAVKKEIFRKLDKVAKPSAIMASNTSFLDLNEIASATNRPENVIGLHFFSPANVMRLLEIVRGAKTSKEAIATALKVAKKIGKTPVLSQVCHGFIANRIMSVRGAQADALILEGLTPQQIDKAIYDYGFAMGPFQMIDLVGLDVIGRDSTERTVMGDLVNLGRLGQKKNGGYYDYDEARNTIPSSIAADVISNFAKSKGIAQRNSPANAEDIVARLLYPVVNEGAKILEEGIAIRASDIDVACILGYSWPTYTGGPMFWADMVGLPAIVAKLKEFEQQYGAAFTPSKLLEENARNQRGFTRK